MKISQRLREAKNTIIEKATTGKGVYITEQIPYLGDYIFAKSTSKISDEKSEKVVNKYYALAMGTVRSITIGACIAGRIPIGSIFLNGVIGASEAVNTKYHRNNYQKTDTIDILLECKTYKC